MALLCRCVAVVDRVARNSSYALVNALADAVIVDPLIDKRINYS
jgi:hypothetical protein